MPGSSPVLDTDIVSIIKRISPSTVFDVGVGAGKYGEILKEIFPSSIVTGCEVDASYLIEFKDKHLFYKNIVIKSIMEIVNAEEVEFDLVIFGDVLEHLKGSEIIDVLDYFQYRTKYILCVYPTGLRQGIWNGHPSERHLSEVKLYEIVNRYDVWEYKKARYESFLMNLVLIKGYL
jgi:hypothetical protein